jgi:glycosyltransferase involved in cell wall biosynthesis
VQRQRAGLTIGPDQEKQQDLGAALPRAEERAVPPRSWADRDVQLLIPSDDVPDPEVSIVVPALNEEIVISEFVSWCQEGLTRAGVSGEILIVDSSTDRTGQLALRKGARVLKVPRRGLGRAYIDALPFVRGRYVIMGDADCTYDFREIEPFIRKLREGYQFVMGSRFRGYIEPGAMPRLHRYLGTPVTTWILNLLYSSRFSDIHCGMRALTLEAWKRLRLESQSWDYASEMVLKSVQLKLRTAEVPVRFMSDRNGRLSHHRRTGWLSPWQAAWINLRAMFVNGADFFVFKPGLVMLGLGLLITLPLTFGPLTIGPLTLSLYWMLLGVTLSLLGLQSFYLGCLAQVIHDYTGAARRRWLDAFPYTRTTLLSGALFFLGVILCSFLVAEYVRFGLALPEGVPLSNHPAVTGLLCMVAGFMTFTFTLLLHAVATRCRTSGENV